MSSPIKVKIKDEGKLGNTNTKKYTYDLKAGLLLDSDMTEKELTLLILRNASNIVVTQIAEKVALEYMDKYKDGLKKEVKKQFVDYMAEKGTELSLKILDKTKQNIESQIDQFFDELY